MISKVIKHDQEMMRKINKGNILNLIREKKPVSKAALAQITNMSPTSVSRIVGELIELGLVKETEFASSKIGRKAVLLNTVSDALYVVSVQIDQDILRISIIDFDGTIMNKCALFYDARSMNWTEYSDKICGDINRLVIETPFDKSKIIGLGIGVPGLIDTANGTVLSSPQLQWVNVPLAEYIKKKLGYKTTVDNIIKAKALAENTYGSAKETKRSAFIHFGTGVGSALILNNTIYRGVTNSAGEIGHTTIDPNGRLCDCGRRGCLQTYLAEHAVLHEAQTVKNISRVEEIFTASAKNEDWAINILNKLHTYMAIAICNIICMYNPNVVIIGGKMAEQPSEIEYIIKRKVDELIWVQFKGSYEIKCSPLGERAGLLGMAVRLVNDYIDVEL